MQKLEFSLSRRITILLAGLELILLVGAVVAFLRLREADGRYARLFEHDTRALLAIPRMNIVLHDAARLTAQRLNAATADEVGRADRELAGIRGRMVQEVAGFRTALPDYSRAAGDFERAFDALLQWAGQVRDATQARQVERARQLMRGQFVPRFEQLRVYLQALSDQLRERMLEDARQAEGLSNQVIRRALLNLVLMLVIGLVLAHVWVWRSVSQPLQGLVAVVRRLMAGDTQVEIPGGGRTDEIGLLAGALGIFRQGLARKQQLEDEERDHVQQLRRGEAEAANQNALQRALVDSIPYPVFIKDAAARFVGCNRAYEAAFGTTAAELRGKTVLDLAYLPPEDRERFHAEDTEVIRSATRKSYELPIRFADGRTHVVLYSVDGFRLADGTAGGLIGLLVDITESKLAEEELRRSQRLLQSVTDHAGAFIFVKDLAGRYLLVNRLYLELTKRPASEILGRTAEEVFPGSSAGKYTAGESEVISTALPQVTEVTMPAGGELRHFLAHKFPLFDGSGRLWAVGGVSTDITDVKRTQEELSRARDAAEAANRAKSAFVATMSHEIRTPMNAVINLTGLALETELSPRQRQYLSVAHSAARGLLALLNDILDFSKIEAGRLELEREAFQLRQILEEVADSFRGRVLETGIEFAVLVEDDVPEGVVGDTLRLRQVLTNLLGNAFKFTERGEIVVRVSRSEPTPDGAADDSVELRFSVRDSGIGIPAEKLDRLFEAFQQADTSTSRRYGGTGLGLAISRRLVGLMGGTMGVTSEPGRGSEFHFTARFGKAPDSAGAVRSSLPPGLEATRALVVTPSALTRELLVSSLRRFGCVAEGVGSGQLALDRLRVPGPGGGFGLVVVDWLLPESSGVDWVRRFHGRDEFAAIPVVMVGAFATDEEERVARESGVRAVVPKPVTGSLLFDAVIRATDLRPELRTPSRAGVVPADLAGRRVLVAEDNEANQFVVREILEQAGAEVVVVPNGQAAIDEWAGGTFDVVLMDMQMPGLDGLEATRRIRAAGADRPRIPIVALTANAMRSDVEACFAAGMDDYLAKPLERSALFATLARWLAPRGPSPASVSPPATPAVDAPPPAAAEEVAGSSVLFPEPEALGAAVPEAAPHVEPGEPERTPVEVLAPAEAAQADPTPPVSEPAPPAPAPVVEVQEGSPASVETPNATGPVLKEPGDAYLSPPPSAHPASTESEPPPAGASPKPRAPRRRRAARENQLDLLPVTETPPEVDVRERIAAGRLPGIDVEDAIQRLGLSREKIEELLLRTARGQAALVDSLGAALRDDDTEEARRLAHAIAGAAGNLSAHELRRHAKTIELALKFGQGNLGAMLEDLRHEAAWVFGGLKVLEEIRAAEGGAGEAAAPRRPAGKPGPATASRELLMTLEGRLRDGDLDRIQEALQRFYHAGIPTGLAGDAKRLEQLIESFEHETAASLVRAMATRLTEEGN